ncbi:transporter, CPA2 family [Anaerococcus hydrogenalis]|nr:transporter, CPA2 family [Anaerococcus hydrogenalis]
MTSTITFSCRSYQLFAFKGEFFMLTSLSLVFLLGLAMGAICQRLKLPKIIGMLMTGMVLGPFVFDVLDPALLSISADLKKMAFIIILLRAGLSLDLADLKKVGRPAVLLSFIPATFEIIGYILLAPVMLGITRMDAAVMGAVLGAASPAVVMPQMVHFMENKYGTKKAIPQMIMAGISCDGIFVIVLFTTFLGMAQGGSADITDFFNVPISIILGAVLGALVGYLLCLFFETAYAHKYYVRNSMKVIIVLGFSFFLIAIETWLEGIVAVSGLLAVVSMACVLKMKSTVFVSKRLSEKFGKLWLAAEVMLFVLVGAAVDIRYTLEAGIMAVLMILTALLFRSCGVLLCMTKTMLTWQERLFCVIAYLPKATVQAAVGSVPLAAGLECGNIVLSVAVMAIVVTAPLGAWGMDSTYKKLLDRDSAD